MSERYVHLKAEFGTVVADEETFKDAVARAERLYTAIAREGFFVTSLDVKFVGGEVPRA